MQKIVTLLRAVLRMRFKWLLRSTFGVAAAALLIWGVDRLFPLPLTEHDFATVVTAVDGTPLRAFADRAGIWRYPVALEDVSPLYIEALMGYEDRWFRYHPGINPLALARAAWQNLRAGRVVSGGSTLTMQTARLIDPHPRTLAGKLGQLLRALQLTWHWSRDEVLVYYLNHAPFGGTLEGVQAAAFTYLGKSAAELSHAEAALLAVLPQAPSRLRPDRAPEAAQRARDKVLDRLADLGAWPAAVVIEAKHEAVTAQRNSAPMESPLLAERLRQAHPGRDVLATLIDWRLQYQTTQVARQYALRLPEGNSVALLVVENATLAVRAYIGSAQFGDTMRFGHVDMVKALRSPGSTLKPFLYGLAIDEGLIHSQSLLSDVPRLSGDYRPGNFSEGFCGPVSASEALQRSLNVPAVQLIDAYGAQTLNDRLKNAGLRMIFPGDGRANPTMILGGVGCDLESLVSGYTALARGGLAGRLRFLQNDPIAERYLMSPGAAWIVRDMLRRPFPGQDRLHLVQHRPAVAWKTGTSYGFRDAWALAVSNAWTVGVWVGRPDGTPSPGQYGAATAAPLLMQTLALLGVTADESPRPASVSEETICWPNGLGRARCRELGSACHVEKRAWVLEGQIPPTLPEPHTGLRVQYQTVLVNPESGRRVDQRCAPAEVLSVGVTLWPKGLEPWLPAQWRRAALIPLPDERCTHMPALAGSEVKIAGLAPGTRLSPAPDRATPPVIALHAVGGLGRYSWFLNGRHVASADPGQLVQQVLTVAGRYQLSVVDEAGNTDQTIIEVLAPP
jgi:penicillin-binding protein 1C